MIKSKLVRLWISLAVGCVQVPVLAQWVDVVPNPMETTIGKTIGASWGDVDGDGDDITYTVEWTVDGIEFTETDSTYLPGDTVPAAQLQADQVWACTITPSDDFDDGEAATASLLVEYPDLVLDASTTTLAAGTYAFDDVTLLNASTLFFEGEVTIRSSTFHVGSSSDLNGLGAGEAGGSAGNAGSGTGGGIH